MRDKTERIITMMNEMEEKRGTMIKLQAYDDSLRDLLRRADEFTSMSDKAQEEILELLSKVHRYFVSK